ncbi:hypothetical protein GQ54DRAFT_297147 [Martensiomyces pterosporus]|nr:hypothetical protein GQ54DRAFT_297147 [Martensiomyces pterosporus]
MKSVCVCAVLAYEADLCWVLALGLFGTGSKPSSAFTEWLRRRVEVWAGGGGGGGETGNLVVAVCLQLDMQ